MCLPKMDRLARSMRRICELWARAIGQQNCLLCRYDRYDDKGRGALGLLHGNCCFYVRDTISALWEMEDGIASTLNLEGHT